MLKHQSFLFIIIFFIFNSVYSQENMEQRIYLDNFREDNIQKALKYREDQNYLKAIEQLNLILSAEAHDAPVLLLKGDLYLQAKEFQFAVDTYRSLLPLDYESTIARINLSYALFMNKKSSEALMLAKSAWESDTTNNNAIVNYFNAMLWNAKTSDANVFLENNSKRLKEDQLMVMKARLFTTAGDFKNGLSKYDSLVNNYSNKYYVQEYAEVLLAKSRIKKAKAIISTFKELYSLKELEVLEDKVALSNMQNAGVEFEYFNDIAKNTRIGYNIWWQQNNERNLKIGIRAGTTKVTDANNQHTQSRFVGLKLNERLNSNFSGVTELNFQNVLFGENKFTAITGRQTIQYQPHDRRMISLYFGSEILNFTASLYEKNIRSSELGYKTHIMLNANNGIYSQGNIGLISDGNKRFQFFGSFYHLFSTTPLLKGGINLSTLSFKENQLETYFSPAKYISSEMFLDYTFRVPGFSNIHVSTQSAAGLQKIENRDWDTALRLMVELSYKLKHHETSLKYQTSDVASGTGTGYKFNWFSFNLIIKW